MSYDISKLRQVTPAHDVDGDIIPSMICLTDSDGVSTFEEKTIFDFLRETKDLR